VVEPPDPRAPSGSWASSPAVRAVMRANRSRNTSPEIRLRTALHRRGFRYRIHYRPLPAERRTVDIAFTRARVAIEVRGCFWHGCPKHGNRPRVNVDYWRTKLDRNRQRDADLETALTAAGWHVIIVWEHEDAEEAADRVAQQVRRHGGVSTPVSGGGVA
jgi:DNA mismatch endonuclease (patch repair protein)